jgi:hypothetical protein
MWKESLGRCRAEATVWSYEALSRGTDVIANRPDLLILDEAHHARNPATRCYAALADLAWGADVLLLTATPIHNRTRDLRALLALFMGSSAYGLDVAELNRMVVRRTNTGATRSGASPLPAVAPPTWVSIPAEPAIMHAITAIPPPVPTSDGAPAHALLQLGLIRAWCSSEAALRETLRRRLRRAAAFVAAIDEGRLPTRRELANWLFVDGAVQLGLPLLTAAGSLPDRGQVRAAIERHADGVRAALDQLDAGAGRGDRARIDAFEAIVRSHNDVAVVAFTQFADTASWLFRATNRLGGVALVSGRGARIASGRVAEEEVVRGFDVNHARDATPALPLRTLIATDVLSEGLSLRRAGVLVHIDIPWTIARLEQRVGRLRRFGSPHRRIAVFAIGPPASARELASTMRALQRKARLASSLIGVTGLDATLPLFGERMRRALHVAQPPVTYEEELRQILRRWVQGEVAAPMRSKRLAGAMALMRIGVTCRLLAVTPSGVSEDAHDIVSMAKSVDTGRIGVDRVELLERVNVQVGRWIEEQRGRELARIATEATSPSHVAVLCQLSQRLHQATRAERVSLGARIARLRDLVTQARGAGAERALQAVIDRDAGIDLDAIEQLLLSRRSHRLQGGEPELLAIVAVQADGTCVAAAREDLVPVTT